MATETALSILIIEDNLGDFTLIEDYLNEQLQNTDLKNVTNYRDAADLLSKPNSFDVILLDLSLPDKNGESLITDILGLSNDVPVIVLTGFENINFSIRSLSLGVSDYLLKDDINATSLYKSVIYNIERKKSSHALINSEKKYSDLFHLSPQPMWIYQLETLAFLDVNQQAILHYGFTKEEFLNMTILDIRPKEDISIVEEAAESVIAKKKSNQSSTCRHQKKTGEILYVDLKCKEIIFNGKLAEIVVVNDITEITRYIRTIQEQNEKFREISWIQSHVIRSPLARMMSLIDLIKNPAIDVSEKNDFLSYIVTCANELDNLIREVSDKTYQVQESIQTRSVNQAISLK